MSCHCGGMIIRLFFVSKYDLSNTEMLENSARFRSFVVYVIGLFSLYFFMESLIISF